MKVRCFNMPRGRPPKFKQEHMKKIKKMALAGFTDKEMSECLSVTEQTFNNWKKKYPDFFESLKDWKFLADEAVEKSLYLRATGYSHPDTKFATYEGQITDSVEYTKHYAPDPTAAIFWLKNRKPKQWKDKQEVQHSGELKLPEITIVRK